MKNKGFTLIRTRTSRNFVSVNGFTLIELLVVIAIIGILASIALVSFTGAQRQARDTNRKSDLKMYQTALTQYASLNKGKYPAYTSTALVSLCDDLDLSNCPSDPSDSPVIDYTYQSNGTSNDGAPKATQYVIYTASESTNDSDDTWVICSTGDVGTYYSIPGGFECPALNQAEPTIGPSVEPTASFGPTPTCGMPPCPTPTPTGGSIPTPTVPSPTMPGPTVTPTSGPGIPTPTSSVCIPGGGRCTVGGAVLCCPGFECAGGRCVSTNTN